MSPDGKLAEVLTALDSVGVRCLVMGGHAVRYYGLDRTTDDFDLHLAPDSWDDLIVRMARSEWLRNRNPIEFPSWRVTAFRRFQIGTLPNGREEWLEFWKENHLLPPFDELFARRESGLYGGRMCDFLSLPDLIRTKETEREKDWQDIQYLEEVQDTRLAAAVRSGARPLSMALSQLRSRRGLETHLLAKSLDDLSVVAEALSQSKNPITAALLLPVAENAPLPTVEIEPAIVNRLRVVPVGSPLHLTLVEAVRRRYKQAAALVDKADKQAIRERLNREGGG